MGGMTKAVESGWAKLKIEECAAEKQAKIDLGNDVIVGVNKYRPDHEESVSIREIDNSAVRDSQIERLERVRAGRDTSAVEHSLHALSECARSGEGNLLDHAVKAIRARATVGEVSDALERVWGRFRATNQVISGVYGAAFGMDHDWQDLREEVESFARRGGPASACDDRQAGPGRA